MKKYISISPVVVLTALTLLFQSCKDNILNKTPEDQFSDATVWTDINLADAYLLNTYKSLGVGFSGLMNTAITDEVRFTHGGADAYMQGEFSPAAQGPFSAPGDPNSPNPFGSWKQYFDNIQKVNVFLSNIDRVAEAASDAEKAEMKIKTDEMKGEALFVRAFCYGQLARLYGGVPLFDMPTELGSDYLSIGRNTFEETVNFVAKDCDDAAALLPDPADATMGRANKGTALALKSRILLFAASDLTADGTAKNKYVGYETPNRQALWASAKAAAKAVMDLNAYSLADFGSTKEEVATNFFEFFKAQDLSNPEVIWGKMYSTSANFGHSNNQYNDANGWSGYSGNSATQALVDAFQMEDGSDFYDHFNKDGNGYFHNSSGTFHSPNPYKNREARFYASILFDSAAWKPRTDPTLQGIDPLGVYDRRTRITMVGGSETFKRFGIDTRQGDRSPDNGGYTGYLMKKTLDNTVNTGVLDNQNAWIEIRYAEIVLNYAEACIGLSENTEAATYINMIRTRAALPDFTGDISEALRHERQVELAFEGSRWFDIRRWKIFLDVLDDAHGVDIVEKTVDGVKTTTWQEILAEPRNVSEKMLWVPISADEINRAPQLVQNPDY